MNRQRALAPIRKKPLSSSELLESAQKGSKRRERKKLAKIHREESQQEVPPATREETQRPAAVTSSNNDWRDEQQKQKLVHEVSRMQAEVNGMKKLFVKLQAHFMSKLRHLEDQNVSLDHLRVIERRFQDVEGMRRQISQLHDEVFKRKAAAKTVPKALSLPTVEPYRGGVLRTSGSTGSLWSSV